MITYNFFKALVICFRLHFTKNIDVSNTAGATVQQLVHVVFERVQAHSIENSTKEIVPNENADQISYVVQDAYWLFKVSTLVIIEKFCPNSIF